MHDQRVWRPVEDFLQDVRYGLRAISYRFWDRRFERSPDVAGAAAVLDGVAVTIVGVAEEKFRGAETGGVPPRDFWIPLALAPRFGRRNTERDFWSLSLIGSGSGEGQSRRHVPCRRECDRQPARRRSAGTAGLLRAPRRPAGGPQRRTGECDRARRHLQRAAADRVSEHRHLLISRSASRRSDLAVWLALGVGRGRLIRQLLAETLTLAFIGSSLGLVLAYWGKALLGAGAFAAEDLDLRINAPVFGVTLLISVVAGFLSGPVPAIRATHRRYAHPAGALELRGSGR